MSAGGCALDGINVLEVVSWIAGPAAAIMSDFGAELITVKPLSFDLGLLRAHG